MKVFIHYLFLRTILGKTLEVLLYSYGEFSENKMPGSKKLRIFLNV